MTESIAYLPHLLGMLGLLLCSGLFSASETALFSLRSGRWQSLRHGGLLGRIVFRLRSRPRDLLVSLLLANLVVNLAYFSLAAGIGIDMQAAGRSSASVAVAVGSVAALVVFGEILPKIVATRRPYSVAKLGALPILVFITGARPAIHLLSSLVGRLTGLLIRVVREPAQRGARLLDGLLDLSMQRGDLLDEERTWLREVLDFSSLRARDVMVPRVDMGTVDITAPRAEALEVVRTTKFSKLPVHDGSLDRITGYVEGKDLFVWPDKPLAELVRPIFVTPETSPLERLLNAMRRDGHTMALVVDEYGGCAGLVVLEDIVHEIIGEVGDEHTVPVSRIQVLEPGLLRVSGSLRVRDWNELGGVCLPVEIASTIGGLVTARLDRPAGVGDIVEFQGVRFSVRAVRGGRVVWLDAYVGARPTRGEDRG